MIDSIRVVDTDIGPCHYGGTYEGRFGCAWPDGTVSMHVWNGSEYVNHKVRCSSYRRAVRLLRMHLKGYSV